MNAATTSFIQSRRSLKVLAMALMAERKTFVSRFGFVESGKSRGTISTSFVAALFLRKKSM